MLQQRPDVCRVVPDAGVSKYSSLSLGEGLRVREKAVMMYFAAPVAT